MKKIFKIFTVFEFCLCCTDFCFAANESSSCENIGAGGSCTGEGKVEIGGKCCEAHDIKFKYGTNSSWSWPDNVKVTNTYTENIKQN